MMDKSSGLYREQVWSENVQEFGAGTLRSRLDNHTFGNVIKDLQNRFSAWVLGPLIA